MSFDKATRNLLAKMVATCRDRLAGDISDQLQTNYGLYPDGTVLDLATTAVDRQAAGLLALLRHYEAQLPDAGKKPAIENPKSKTRPEQSRRAVNPLAYRRLVREIGFTTLNRLAALRLAEERGLVIECVRQGMRSAGFQLFDRLAGGALGHRAQSYRAFLENLFDELALDLGLLFDRHNPLSAVFPGEAALTGVLEQLNDPELAGRGVWRQDETIGWIYQYYNDPAERKAMRDASQAPRNSRELAVRNQFFTPRYVVEFLTDNTLGRLWYEMSQGQTGLAERCRYLARRPIEIFLDDPDSFLPDGCRDWVRQVRNGDFSELPNDPTESELAAISLAFNGYDLAERLGDYGDFFGWANDQVARLEKTGQLSLTSSLDLWLVLFAFQRSWRMLTGSGPVGQDFLSRWRQVYLAWKKAMQADQTGLSQEELLRRPVYIPYRPLKDPRDLKMLDPACGSMHFGLYAFDLFEVIYEEAWTRGIINRADFGYRPAPIFLHETVKLNPQAAPRSNYASKRLDVADAFVVISRRGDFGDGVEPNFPYLVDSETRFRVPFDFKASLAEFDYWQTLKAGWFAEPAGEKMVRDTGAFLFDEMPAMSEAEAQANFRRQIPKLIIEHNIHGIDIDPRAVQIAGLSLWLRAQKSWQRQGVSAADRPAITRSNLVTAEPMPGDAALLDDFIRRLPADRRDVLGYLLHTIVEKMELAGEAGALLKIEVELDEAIKTARELVRAQRDLRQATLPGFDLPPAAEQLAFDWIVSPDNDAFWQTAEKQALEALQSYAEQMEDGAGTQRRLFAEDAARGFAFIDLCRQEYDVVLMNPPFGASSKPAKSHIEQRYPLSKNDVYAAFVERWLARLNPGGKLGAITSRTGFFLSSFQKWREQVVLQRANPTVFADLGFGVLDAAMVETAAYCLEVKL